MLMCLHAYNTELSFKCKDLSLNNENKRITFKKKDASDTL